MTTSDFSLYLPGQVFVRIDDKKRGKPPVQLVAYDEMQFKKWNDEGWGIYFTSASFRHATPEEHKENKTAMDRNARYRLAIHYISGDLDIAKEGEQLPLDVREERKSRLYESLCAKIEPAGTIFTANGIQPHIRIKDISAEDTEGIKKCRRVVKGMIIWSKEHGAKGDAVHDPEHLFRVPGYYHHKGEPYLCSLVGGSDRVYDIDELLAIFPYDDPEPEKKMLTVPSTRGSDVFAAIGIRDIVIHAYRAIGRQADFDSQGRLVLDGRQTGNFQGRLDDHQYIATSSGTEPIKGNKVTVAAQILGCNNTEAVGWLRKEFRLLPPGKAVLFDPSNLPFQTMNGILEQSSAYLETITPESIFSWGFPPLDEHLGGIYRGELILVGGESGMGKTTFLTSVLKHNAKAHRVCYFTLEDTLLDHGLKQLYFMIGKVREERGSKNYPWQAYRNNSLTEKQEYIADRDEAIRRMVDDSLLFYDCRHSAAPPKLDIDTLEALVASAVESGVGLIGIDHLHYFDNTVSPEWESKADRIEKIMQRIKALTEKYNVAVILLAHYRKLFGEKPTIDSFKDSISIPQTANVVINLWRNRGESKAFAKAQKKHDSAQAKVQVLEEGRADREASGKGSTAAQERALITARANVIAAQVALARAEHGDEQTIYDTHFMMPKVRSPAGEKTIVMRFNPQTFEYEYVASCTGTKQELSAEEKAELFHPKRSLF